MMFSMPQKNIFYLDGENQVGPISLSKFNSAFQSGHIKSTSLIWFPEIEDWSPLSKLPELHESCKSQSNQNAYF